MFGFGKVTCTVCHAQIPQNQALRAKHKKDVGVCKGCYEQWERSGKPCADCHLPVRGSQEMGVFTDRGSFGHADCGAEWLAA